MNSITKTSQRYFNKLVKAENKYSMAVAIILALIAVVHIPLSLDVSKHITSTTGVVILLILALSLLMQKSRVVMVLGLFVLYKLYYQARDRAGVLINSVVQESVFRQLNTQNDKDALYDKVTTNIPKTLEEEMVDKMAPNYTYHRFPTFENKNKSLSFGNFKPVLSEIHGATAVGDL